VLMSYGDPNNPTFAQPGVVTTAIFSADGMLNGSAGCNNYNTSYTVQEDRISIELPTSTLMACDTGMEQEQAYLAALGLAESYQVLGSILVITYASGSAQIRFSAQHMPLENIRWVLSSIDGQRLPVGVEAYAVFTPGKDNQDNQVSGSSGCNGFSGKYSVEGDKLAIPGPFGTTQMSCPEEVMQVEHSFLAALENSQSFETVLKQLTITTSNGLLIFTADRMPLEGPIWKLTALGSADNPQAPVSGADFTAIFSRQPGMPSGVMAGTTGCINSTNTYYANLKEIKLNPASRSDGTCSAELANQMESYFDGLNKAREYRILGSELQILYDDQVLKYTGTYPTGEGEAGPLTPLNGTIWRLVSIGATPAIPGSDTTAQISVNPDGLSGHISGSAGCNTYNALITGVFTVGPASVTQTVCDNPPGIMNQEGAYLSALGAATSFSLEGEQLRISTDQGLLVFTRQGPSAVQPLPPTETPEAVQPVPLPEAVISAPNAGNVDQVITFDGSGSTASTAIGAYLWDFGDGATGEGPVLDHTFTNAGTYTVTLTVTDANNQTGSTTLVVTIE
jgi:heat shock protein HslJ